MHSEVDVGLSPMAYVTRHRTHGTIGPRLMWGVMTETAIPHNSSGPPLDETTLPLNSSVPPLVGGLDGIRGRSRLIRWCWPTRGSIGPP
jgi:hypothetical protein